MTDLITQKGVPHLNKFCSFTAEVPLDVRKGCQRGCV